MKRLIFAIVTTLAVTNLYATPGGREVVKVDTINVPKYINNFKFDYESFDLTFYDNFQKDKNLDRMYIVHLYHFYPLIGLYHVLLDGHSPRRYLYGGISTENDDDYELVTYHAELPLYLEYNANGSYGGKHTVSGSKLRSQIYEAYQKFSFFFYPEEEGIHVIVEPRYKDKVTGEYTSYYSDDENKQNCWLINGYDINKRSILSEVPVNTEFFVEYNGKSHISMSVHADDGFYYTWESSSDKKNWQVVDAGEIQTAEAKTGLNLHCNYTFNRDGEYPRWFRLLTETSSFNPDYPGAHGRRDTSEAIYVHFRYPFESSRLGDNLYDAGEKFVIDAGDKCMKPFFTANLPVAMKQKSESTYEVTMPACPVECGFYINNHVVKFINADGSVLKTETLHCGEDATPPANPTIAGMTFAGWQGEYKDVTSDRNIYASYKVDGYELSMELVSHKTTTGDEYAYEITHGEGFAGSASMAMEGDEIGVMAFVQAAKSATVFFERATYNSSGEIINWGSEKVATLTDSEARNGKWINYTEQIGSTYSNKSKTAFRFKVTGYSVAAAYSNVLEYDIWHPLTVMAERPVQISNNNFTFTGTYSVIPVYELDTLRIATSEGSTDCELLFHCPNYFQQKPYLQGSDERGQYVIMLGMKETMTISVREFTVRFIADGLEWPNQSVKCSGSAQAPEVPKKEGYIFRGWKKTYANSEYDDYGFTCVTENMSFTAWYEKRPDVPVYDVTFLDYEGNVIVTQQVPEGENATPPQMLVREGYTFTGWDGDYCNVTGNLTLKPVYIEGTAVESISAKQRVARKQIVDGTMQIVLPDGRAYNAQGISIKNEK